MVKPTRMEVNANYHLFKKGIKPLWEDTANAQGGKWIINIKTGDKFNLDNSWENLVLSVIGETLDNNEEICGVVISRRKMGDRIAVWNKNRDDEAAVLAIGKKLKAILGLDKLPIQYQIHEDSIRTGTSYANAEKYTL